MAERQSQIVLGLDPDPMDLWPQAHADGEGGKRAEGETSPAARAAATAVAAHCRALIDAAGLACVAVKPQLARFETLGAPGWQALEATVAYARAAGLLVIADAKRGDIDVSARAYAQALLGSTPTPSGDVLGLGADMVTVNPFMGADSVAPFVEVARANGAGVLLLVRTSNPGAADIEDLKLEDGAAVWERVAMLADRLGRHRDPGIGGLSDVGAVIGATAPEHLVRARELMPNAVFLLPGVGAQGGKVEDLAPAFAPGIAGGLVTASRSIAQAYKQHGGDPAQAALAEAERLQELAWALAHGG